MARKSAPAASTISVALPEGVVFHTCDGWSFDDTGRFIIIVKDANTEVRLLASSTIAGMDASGAWYAHKSVQTETLDIASVTYRADGSLLTQNEDDTVMVYIPEQYASAVVVSGEPEFVDESAEEDEGDDEGDAEEPAEEPEVAEPAPRRRGRPVAVEEPAPASRRTRR